MRTTILVLVALLAFVAYRLGVVENERYALLLDMCKPPDEQRLLRADPTCLSEVKTRDPWVWNVFYGLTS